MCFFAYTTLDIIEWLKLNHEELSVQASGIFGSYILLTGGAIKYALENVMKHHEGDDQYKDS